MGRIIALTAKSQNGQPFNKPRVVYLQEDAIRVTTGGKTSKGTCVEEILNGRVDRFEVYEKSMHVEAMRNPSTSDVLIKQHCALALAGLGTTQGAGLLLDKYLSETTTIGAAATEAFRLDPATVGKVKVIVNNDVSGDAAKIFPAVGEFIGTQAVNTVYSLPSGKRLHLVCLVAGKWTIAEDFGA